MELDKEEHPQIPVQCGKQAKVAHVAENRKKQKRKCVTTSKVTACCVWACVAAH